MTRKPNSPDELDRRVDLVAAGNVERERTNGANGVREAPYAPQSESMTRDSILGACPRRAWNPDPQAMLVFDGRSSPPGAEEFRALRSHLYQVQAKGTLKSILVTSALRHEGRSFVAASLAQVIALQPESRVLLIDADLRNPRLHSALGTSATPGFSEYLLQEAEEFSIMQRGSADNLFLVASGRPVTCPTELVGNGRVKSFLDRIEPLFDWIIVDSPAVMPASDARLLANYCDGVLIVVRSESTPYDVVRRARQKFNDASLLGVVLNVVETAPVPASSNKSRDGLGS